MFSRLHSLWYLWHSLPTVKLLQLLLAALLPLLERRVLAAERQATATERQEDLLRTYLYWCHSEFRDTALGLAPDQDLPPDVEADHGPARDLKLVRMDAIAEMYLGRFGSHPTDEQVVLMYEQMYERDERANSAASGPGVEH